MSAVGMAKSNGICRTLLKMASVTQPHMTGKPKVPAVGFSSSQVSKGIGRRHVLSNAEGLTQTNADFDLLSASSALIRVPMDDY